LIAVHPDPTAINWRLSAKESQGESEKARHELRDRSFLAANMKIILTATGSVIISQRVIKGFLNGTEGSSSFGDVRLTMNHYTDASRLPLAEAIKKLPNFRSSDNTQIRTQTPDVPCNRQSPCGTSPVGTESSKVVYPEEFWHDRSPIDTVGQSDEKTCLARIRT
jgi:hypothetical protein